MTRARELLAAAAGPELLERLDHLDALGARPRPEPERPIAPSRADAPDVDVVIAGGGLSLLYAPLLAGRGLRVAVLDRARVGEAHREWNASDEELRVLVRLGLLSPEELEATVIAAYREGFCRFGAGPRHVVRGALDRAVDAGALLEAARARALERGVRVLDHHEVVGVAPGEGGVRVRARHGGAAVELVGRVLVEARGASRAVGADLACPTVGGVVEGLEEGDGPDRVRPDVGEILVTTEGVEEGRQHVWEVFPGRPGQSTLYLFAYLPSAAMRPGMLTELYARFFERLPAFKRGSARLVRPTFGVIPGWSRLRPPPTAPHPRVVLVGDAAARHSPLTFCGFGATLRSLAPATAVIEEIAGAPPGEPRAPRVAVDDAAAHALTGALARLLAEPPRDPSRRDDRVELCDVAFGTLVELGEETYRALLRDELPPREVARFLLATSRKRPDVYREVARSLGALDLGRWTRNVGLGVVRQTLGVRA